jgi:hypothetical protein
MAAALGIVLLTLFMPGDGGDGEPNNPLPGSLLSVGGSIEPPGAQDRYTFTADKGQRIHLDVRECASTGTLVWSLLRPDDDSSR